ncbi:hypothetical protein JC881_12675 [Variovorax sp. IB41]|nr:hypothetical protein [Variovorax sp. IB41]
MTLVVATTMVLHQALDIFFPPDIRGSIARILHAKLREPGSTAVVRRPYPHLHAARLYGRTAAASSNE